jgi:TonB family protein
MILAAAAIAAAPPVSGHAAADRIKPARVLERVKSARVLERVTAWARPTYPEAARAARTTGAVAVDVMVSETGALVGTHVLSGPDTLRDAAEAALREWQFRPAAADEPHGEIKATLTFDFTEEYGGFYATLRRDADSVTKHTIPAATGRAEVENGRMAPAVQLTYAAPPLGVNPIGKVASKAVILNRPRPNYTEQARRNATEGTIVVKVLLARDGVVRKAGIVVGLPDGLNARAIDAISTLEFTPARNADGAPIDSWVTVAVNFTIH